MMKLDKFIADTGFASRRKALQLIEQKLVRVNGKKANVFTPVDASDTVSINGQVIRLNTAKPVLIMYHKPKGIVCTTEKIEGNIIDAVKHPQQIYPIGRLDKDSEGLILLTNQSTLIDKIANPAGNHEKEYVVTLNHPLRKQFLEDLSRGIKIDNQITKPCTAVQEPGTKRVMRITITQGLNRQIRKMCNAYQYQVIKLQRVRVMNIQLGHLKLGEWRDLTDDEVKVLMSQLGTTESAKVEKVHAPKKAKPKPAPTEAVKEIKLKTMPALMEKQKRLKKHEIKAKQKNPWKKMQLATQNNLDKKNKAFSKRTAKKKGR